MSDIKLGGECAEELVAWIKSCRKSGGGDEHTCVVKSADAITVLRAVNRIKPDK
jgi:hypothetical protein